MIKWKKNLNIINKFNALLVIFLLTSLFLYSNKVSVGEFFLYETVPFYGINMRISSEQIDDAFINEEDSSISDNEKYIRSLQTTSPFFTEKENSLSDTIIGINDIRYQHELKNSIIENSILKKDLTVENIESMRDLTFLKNNFYIVDSLTGITSEDFDVDKFISADLSIDNTVDGPKVLIFHTHAGEMYSNSKDISEGVIGVGNELASILENTYGIKTLHVTKRFDLVDGKPYTLGSYERMEEYIPNLLKENPSIEVVLDIHRDGVPDDVRLVTEINNVPTAKIMYFNGLSKIMDSGKLKDIPYLKNIHKDTNLALSFQMQLLSNKMHPGFTRKVYLHAYRFSLSMMPKSMLIEVGAQTNTKEEAYNAMHVLAEILATLLIG
jgi:stage II sporulation protein P